MPNADLDALRSASTPQGGNGACLVGRIIAAATKKDRETIEAALADREQITNPVVFKWLRDRHGYRGSESLVRNHRAGRCACSGQSA